MSYEIEYNEKAYILNGRYGPDAEKDYLVLVEQGSNNCYEGTGRNARRVRDWEILAYGWAYSVIGEVCRRAGSCEGGMLKVRGRWTKPEAYLRRYRKLLKAAVPFEKIHEDFVSMRGSVYCSDAGLAKLQADKYSADQLAVLRQDEDWTYCESKPFDQEKDFYNRHEWTMYIKTEADFRKFHAMRGIFGNGYIYASERKGWC